MYILSEELNIETKEIKKLLDLLSNLFNIRTAFIYAINEQHYYEEIAGKNGDFHEYCYLVQTELKEKCTSCDSDKFSEAKNKREQILYRCYNGLYEMFLPIFIENILVGYLHFGQVRGEDEFSLVLKECNLHEHSKVKILESIYNSMPVFKTNTLILISEVFQIIAQTILRERMIELKKANPLFYLKKYVDENYNNDINIQSAAEYIGRSTSFVTHSFKNEFNTSFNNYRNDKRIERAKNLLKSHSISETYELCGFKNRYHFSKVFKKNMNITPYEYQQKIQS
jgi:AraC-like DNA-binding protein